MHPVLVSFEISGRTLTLHAYPTLLVLAGFAALAVGTFAAARVGLPWRRSAVAFAAALASAVVGARLLHVATNLHLYTSEPARIWALDATGLAPYGGPVVGRPAGPLAARAPRLRRWPFPHPGAAAGRGGGPRTRGRSLLQGCCYGRPTDLPWGVDFPPGSPAWARQMVDGSYEGGGSPLFSGLLGAGGHSEPGPVHPTQLYELGAALIALAIVVVLLRRRTRPGTALLGGALWFTAFRLANAQFRWPPSTLTAPAWFYPALYGSLLLGLAMLLIWRHARREGRQSSTAVAVRPAASA